MTTTTGSIGSQYDPTGADLQCPYAFYERAQDAGEPVFYSPAIEAWVATRHQDLMTVLRDPETYSSVNALPQSVPPKAVLEVLRRGYPPRPSATDSDGELHRRLRPPLASLFTQPRIAALLPFLGEQAEALVSDMLAGERPADVLSKLAYPLPSRLFTRLCDITDEQMQIVNDGLDGMIRMTGAALGEAEQIAAAEQFVALQHLAGRLVNERRGSARTDGVSEVVRMMAPGDGPMDFELQASVVANVLQLIIAGMFTTPPTIANALGLALEQRGTWEQLCKASPAQLATAVEELLRVGTAVSALYRTVTRATELGGVEVPEGARLVLRYNAANRDRSVFPSPHEVQLDRSPNRHLTFGQGDHYCIGAPLVREELRILLGELTRRIPTLRLASPVRLLPLHNFRAPMAVHVTW